MRKMASLRAVFVATLLAAAVLADTAVEEAAEQTQWVKPHSWPHTGVFVGGARIPARPPLPPLPGIAALLNRVRQMEQQNRGSSLSSPFARAGIPAAPLLSTPTPTEAATNAPKPGNVKKATGCKFTIGDEDFDLTALTLKPGEPEYATEDSTRSIYKMNICGVTTTTVAGSECMRNNGMVCQYRASPMMQMEGVIARWGQAPYPTWSFIDEADKSQGVKLFFENGDDCSFRGFKRPRQAEIYFPCDKTAGFIGNILAQETEQCHYVFTVPTQYSCSSSSGMSSGWIFIILVIIFTSLYIGLGCVYNRFRHQTKGVEAIPNLQFWQELPGLVKDGCLFSYAQAQTVLQGRKQHSDDI